MDWLARVPTAVAAQVCAALSVRDLVRFRRASRDAAALTKLAAASPAGIGVCSAAALEFARTIFARVDAFDIAMERARAAPEAETSPAATTPSGLLSTPPERSVAPLLEALPQSLLATLHPHRLMLEVDQARVCQIGAALVPAVDSVATAVAPLHSLPKAPPPCGWSRCVTHLALLMHRDPSGAGWSAYDLTPLTALDRLHTLEIADGFRIRCGELLSARRLCRRLPALPRLRKLAIAHLYAGESLHEIGRAFPNLEVLADVEMLPTHPDSGCGVPIADADWLALPHLTGALCTVDAREPRWSLPLAVETLSLTLMVDGDDDRAGRAPMPPYDPRVPIATLGPQNPIAALWRTQSRIQWLSLSVGGASLDVSWLLYDLPTLRELRIHNFLHLCAGSDDDDKGVSGSDRSVTAVGLGGTQDEKVASRVTRESYLQRLMLNGDPEKSVVLLPATRFSRLSALKITAAACDIAALSWPLSSSFQLSLSSALSQPLHT